MTNKKWYKKHITIWVDRSTFWKLHEIRIKLKVRSLNDVINSLINEYEKNAQKT